jgi:hypothetical protein
MPGAGKPEARAEGIRVGVRWSNAYSLTSRFGLPSNPAGGNGQTTQSTTGAGASPGTTVGDRRYNAGHAGCRMPDAGCRMPDAGCRMPDAGCRMPGSPRRKPREYGSVSGGATRIPSACASGFQAIRARRSETAATESTTVGSGRGTTGDRARRSATAAPTRARRSENAAARRMIVRDGQRPPLQRGPCRVPGSPRREPREYGSVSGGATRIPSACDSAFRE